MSHVLSFVAIVLLLVFLMLPLAGLVLWVAVLLFGYTPPFWLALVVGVGMLLHFVLWAGRPWHPVTRTH